MRLRKGIFSYPFYPEVYPPPTRFEAGSLLVVGWFSFSGCRLTVTCVKGVTGLPDLYISYCDTTLPTHLRQDDI